MTDKQNKIADMIVRHFQTNNGFHTTAMELATILKLNLTDAKYVTSMLTIKGILNNTELVVLNSAQVLDEKYFLSDKGWSYKSWRETIEIEEEIAEEDKRKKERLELEHIKSSVQTNESLIKANKSSIQANQSMIETNDNVKITNDSVRSLNKYQKWILGFSIGIAALTTLFIGLTYREQRKDQSQERLQELVQKEREILKTMQDIQSSLIEINSSIEKLKMDSVSVRLKK
jgi:hypothetical protein